jgi:hydrogenase expression/formation protein HypE
MISVVEEGVIAGSTGFSAMHDVTEGGVLGAVWELCYTAGAGCLINKEAIPVSDVTKKICAHYKIDSLRLISSGCMVIITGAENKEKIEGEMKKAGIKISLIGEVREKDAGIMLESRGAKSEIMPPESDELYKVVK